jgi:RHS repeat-associated protein
MGNIKNLSRYQAGTLIDQLTYSYLLSSNPTNQAQTITDGSGNDAGLLHGGWSYGYDPNGNLTSSTYAIDPTKNKNYTYNLLNLPLVATVPTGTATYTYDATGNKLRKVDVLGGTTTTTDYITGIEYDNSTSTIGFIQTEEGKAVPLPTGGYDYVYYLGDNLGNTRVTFGTHTGSAATYQVDDYYPFGLEINRTPYTPKNEYLYNRKELQEETQSYDFSARGYDPLAVHWNTIDPLAEVSRRWSPYSYVMDNPIRFIDPDGMETEDEINEDEQRWASESAGFQNGKSSGNFNGGSVSSNSSDQPPPKKKSNTTAKADATATASKVPKVQPEKKDPNQLATATPSDQGTISSWPPPEQVNYNDFGNPTTSLAVVTNVVKFTPPVFAPELEVTEIIDELQTAYEGFGSFNDFKAAYGSAGDGLAWHHIVEQNPSNIETFGPEAIHTESNLVKLESGAGPLHARISGYYSSKQPFTNGLTVRQWLSGQSFQQQYNFGIKVIQQFSTK